MNRMLCKNCGHQLGQAVPLNTPLANQPGNIGNAIQAIVDGKPEVYHNSARQGGMCLQDCKCECVKPEKRG